MSDRTHRRLAAIVAADVAGFSRLVDENEEATLASLRAHRVEFIDPLVEAHGGRVANTAGDSLLLEFPSAVDALRFAIAFQEGMAKREAGVEPSRQIRFRAGVNVGDVITEGRDLLGSGVNVAARLEALAEPGGIILSRSARDQVRDQLKLALEDLGEVEVKNIARPVRAFRYAPERVQGMQPARKRRGLAGWRPTVAGLSVVAAGLAGLAWFADWQLPSRSPLPGASALIETQAPRLSIAVLPFENLSGDPGQAYFADALTEDLTVDLSRISGSFVISRNTAASFADTDIDAREIARELGVRFLLEGTVRRGQNDVRVSVQLTDGETGQQVWSERYEKTARDMYTFQNEVTGRVARALNLELKDAMSRQAARGGMGDLAANDLALRAWAEIWTKPQKPETNAAGLNYARQALELDPDNVEALGVAAYAYARAATYGWGMALEEAVSKGLEVGQRAVELDPNNPDALYALGFLHYRMGDTRRSLELMRQCIELNRNHAPAYFFSGVNLLRLGDPQEAIEWIERAFALSPRDPLRSVWYGIIGRAEILLGEDERALATARKGIVANPRHPHNYAVLASGNANLGRMEEAASALHDLLDRQPELNLTTYRDQVAGTEPLAIRSYERLLAGLRAAGLPES